MSQPTLESNIALLHRLARGSIPITLASGLAANVTTSRAVIAFNLPYNVLVTGGRWSYSGTAAVTDPVVLTVLKNGAAITGLAATTIAGGTAANSGDDFDPATFVAFELKNGDVITCVLVGDTDNAAGSVVGVSFTAVPL